MFMIQTREPGTGTVLFIAAAGLLLWSPFLYMPVSAEPSGAQKSTEETKTVVLAGGCFWCVEADLEKLDGVVEAVSGYSGGKTEQPTYEDYADGGHREVVKVTYVPKKVSYRQLLTYFLKHIDPTDGKGSFVDRGEQYSPAIYCDSDEKKRIAREVLETIQKNFEEELKVPVLPRQTFWKAEKYHQDYYKKSSLRYKYYRTRSGRDQFIEKHWGDRADDLPPRKKEKNGSN